MSEHHAPPGPDPAGAADKIKHETQKSQAKADAARHERDVEADARRAERIEEKAHSQASSQTDKAKAGKAGKPAPAGKSGKAPAKKAAKGKAPAKKAPRGKASDKAKPAEPEPDEKIEVVDAPIQPKQKPELDDGMVEALEARAQKKAKTPVFRRHEWWRYKDLGGKHAPWRRPRGIHSKQRRHFKYRPPVVSIGYRGPRAARGLHPSGFEEVLVYRPKDLGAVDPKTQAARVGGTVGGRKAELIEKEADKLGIRVLNRRN